MIIIMIIMIIIIIITITVKAIIPSTWNLWNSLIFSWNLYLFLQLLLAHLFWIQIIQVVGPLLPVDKESAQKLKFITFFMLIKAIKTIILPFSTLKIKMPLERFFNLQVSVIRLKCIWNVVVRAHFSFLASKFINFRLNVDNSSFWMGLNSDVRLYR